MASVEKSEFLQLTAEPEGDIVKSFKKASVKRQYFAVICLDLLAFSFGATCGWPSAGIPILKSEDTPLETGPITTSEASYVASGICIGGFFGNLIFGWIANRFGQKVTLYLVALPQILSWLFIYYARTPFYLILSRVVGGFAGGGFYSVAPTYISEISDNKVRGTLGSTIVFSCNLGIFWCYFCGEYFEYLTVPWLMIPASFLFLVLFMKVPDSPVYLTRKNLYDKAERSFLYFRNVKKHSKQAKPQLEDLQKLHIDVSGNENELSIDDFKTKYARRAIIYGICLMALNQFCGCFAMLNFTAVIFKESGSTMSPNVSSIIVAAIQIIGSMFPTFLVDRLGRKLMMVTSAIGTSVGLAALGGYMLLKFQGFNVETFNWIPLVAFSFTIFIANWGVLTLPFMIISEITHPKIRGFVTVLCMSFLWIFSFIAIKFLSSLIAIAGMHGTMFLFAVNSLVGALFVITFLPETKGKSFDEIVDLL